MKAISPMIRTDRGFNEHFHETLHCIFPCKSILRYPIIQTKIIMSINFYDIRKHETDLESLINLIIQYRANIDNFQLINRRMFKEMLSS